MRKVKKIIPFIIENFSVYNKLLKRAIPSAGKRFLIFFHMCLCALTDGATPEHYVWLEFWHRGFSERKDYLTFVRQRKLKRRFNNADIRYVMNHKDVFNERFREFIKRDFLLADTASDEEIEQFISRNGGAVIAKPNYNGSRGRDVRKVTSLREVREGGENCILEEVVAQHPQMNEFNPNCVNTVRVSTICKDREVCIFSATVKMGISENCVDNGRQGGIFAQVDAATGEITTDGMSIDGDKYDKNPYTGKKIKGSQIPCWEEVRKIVTEASRVISDNCYIGWDVAISPDGPVIIEGNDTQCVGLMQRPSQIGKYRVIREFLQKQSGGNAG